MRLVAWAWVLAASTGLAAAPQTQLSRAIVREGAGALAEGWRLSPPQRAGSGSGSQDGSFEIVDGRVVVTPPAEGGETSLAVASFTVPTDAPGFYALEETYIRRDSEVPGQIRLRVWVQRAHATGALESAPAVDTNLSAGEVFDFDAFLGYLAAGGTVHVGVGAAGSADGDRTQIDYLVRRVPAIPVADLRESIAGPRGAGEPRRWDLIDAADVRTPAARRLAWGSAREARRFAPRDDGGVRVHVPSPSAQADRAAVVAFRAPHSGYYALHEASLRAAGASVSATVYVGADEQPRRPLTASPGTSVSLNCDLGYMRQGDVLCLAFAAKDGGAATADLRGSVVEWAPRRAPLRVKRGEDGLLDVFEPEAPLKAIDIPRAAWVQVDAPSGDATDVIRDAIARAQAQRPAGGYVGVRLQTGQTYTVGSSQVGGALFAIRDGERLVFDGNGAIIDVASPELSRTEIQLFNVVRSRNIAIADLVVTGRALPFTVGEVLKVDPPDKTAQTVTFRVDPDQLDPITDIRRKGDAEGYAYDPGIPGRLAVGTWTHFPGGGPNSLRRTDEPHVFTHQVRRTGMSIRPGQKWLVKNKNASVVYLSTEAGAENVTLSGIDGRATGGSYLRFWQTSGVNILDCIFEPQGDAWISSSADGVHGRGREGVWIENTIIRGVCEDIMNTYGENMVVVADDDPSDATMSIRMFRRHNDAVAVDPLALPDRENVLPGDQLVFFNPKTGRVLGYASVRSIEGGRFTLSNEIDDVDPWEEGDGKGATMVYNTRAAGRFFVRDSRFADSLRYGIYIKARGGVIFHTQFEGLSSAAVGATNEPEWPEGPPATHLWVQDCFFSQNNYGYQSQHRAFMTVDPADISVYTRKLGDGAVVGDEYGRHTEFRAHVTKGQFANSHLKILDNVFHDWRGMAVAVRNARNVRIEGNLFLAPVEDEVLRRTFAADDELSEGDVGRYAAVYLASVNGVRLVDNRFCDLPAGDKAIVRGSDVESVETRRNEASAGRSAPADVAFSIGEWFGATSPADDGARGLIQLAETRRELGRLGAGLLFEGRGAARVEGLGHASPDAAQQVSVSLWTRPAANQTDDGVLFMNGDDAQGLLLGVRKGRWVAGCWSGDDEAWLDLGEPVPGVWQHLGLVWDGATRSLRGFSDGLEVASSRAAPVRLDLGPRPASLGGAVESAKRSGSRATPTRSTFYRGGIDEIRIHRRALSQDEMAAAAFRR